MKRLIHRIAPVVALGCGFLGCTHSTETVTTQSRSSWMKADPAAITSAEMEPEHKIAPGTHMAAGRIHEMQGAYQKALEQYEDALKGEPKNVGALNRIAMVDVRLGKFNAAKVALDKAIKLQPKSALLYNNLGYTQICCKDWESAESAFRKALELQPTFSRARVNLAISLARQDRLDDALDEFRAVVPEPDALYNLGLVLRGMKRNADAAQAFELALERDQHFVAAQKQLADLAQHDDAQAKKSRIKTNRSWGALSASLAEKSAKKAAKEESAPPAKVASSNAHSNMTVPTVKLEPIENAVPPENVAAQPVARTASMVAEPQAAPATPVSVAPQEETIENAEPVIEEIPAAEPVETTAAADQTVDVDDNAATAKDVANDNANDVVVSVAPITQAESESANATAAVPSAVVDISPDGKIGASEGDSENTNASVVRINTAISSDAAGMLNSLQDDAFQAAADGVLVMVNHDGVSVKTAHPVEDAVVTDEASATPAEEVQPTALTGFVDTPAAKTSDTPKAEVVAIEQAEPVQTATPVEDATKIEKAEPIQEAEPVKAAEPVEQTPAVTSDEDVQYGEVEAISAEVIDDTAQATPENKKATPESKKAKPETKKATPDAEDQPEAEVIEEIGPEDTESR